MKLLLYGTLSVFYIIVIVEVTTIRNRFKEFLLHPSPSDLLVTSKYRLPDNVQPCQYTIVLRPDLDRDLFTGNVSIDVLVKSTTTSIVLHSSGLNISKVLLDDCSVEYKLQPEFELITIFYKNLEPISPCRHNIYFEFEGVLPTNYSLGFFKAKNSEDEKKRYSAVSDFQAVYTRKAFPCFDEPSFKARFHVTLIAPNRTYTSLSNMPAIRVFETANGIATEFETSCLMPPYLVTFAVTPYPFGEYIANDGFKDIPIRIYSASANNVDNRKPLEEVGKFLRYYTNYTQIEYPLKKIDLIEYDRAQSGATENWGLITAKTGLLSPQYKIYTIDQITTVLAHELSHFWFGNLVTNKWWDDIWLQEGFAVFMSIKAESDLSGENQFLTKFPGLYLDDIYMSDNTPDSKAVVSSVETPAQIEDHFNDNTYSKGAEILRMIEVILGEEVFRETLQLYLKKFAYDTATSDDFISLIQQHKPDVDMKSFIESYLYLNTYPLIEVSDNEKEYVLKQMTCARNITNPVYKYRWTIPITYISELKPNISTLVWFKKDQETLKIPKTGEKWIKFNYQQVGLYRIHYSPKLWHDILANLKDIEPYERKHLLSEVIQFYLTDYLPCNATLNLLAELSKIEKALPVSELYLFLMYARDEIQPYDDEAYEILESYLYTLHHKKRKRPRTKKINNAPIEPDAITHVRPGVITCSKWIKMNLPAIMKSSKPQIDPNVKIT